MMYPGFVFWGLFIVFGLLIAGYILWMYRADRKEEASKNEES